MALDYDNNPDYRGFSQSSGSVEYLVGPAWVGTHAGTAGLALFESDSDSQEFDIGHLPYAMRLDFAKDLRDPQVRDILSPSRFAQLMSQRGVSVEDTVVTYGDRHNVWGCFAAWILSYYGHPDVRLLDGGRDAWVSAERELVFYVPQPAPTVYPEPTGTDASIRATVADVVAAMEAGSAVLVDVRSEAAYAGDVEEPGAVVHGHIPGAINLPGTLNVQPSGFFQPPAVLARTYRELDPDSEIIVYSGMGATAAQTWFVLSRLLGFCNVRLYDGSWTEWGNMVGMPVVVGSTPE
ncbi:MAG: sulfurtransferase [Corynebacterium sp.]|nr:sulfurtransferase [Corynebacterium sp.]